MNWKELLRPTQQKLIVFLVFLLIYIIYMLLPDYSINNLFYAPFVISEIPLLVVLFIFMKLANLLVIEIAILPLIYSYFISVFFVWLFEKYKWKSIPIIVTIFGGSLIIGMIIMSGCYDLSIVSFGKILERIMCLVM